MNHITKQLIRDFIKEVPLEIHYLGSTITVVGIRWGYCKETDEQYGRKTVLRILDLLETKKEYQELLDETPA